MNWPNCLHHFLLLENVSNFKIGTTMFYVAYRTLLVMFCVRKFYFVDFYGMFTSSPTWRLKMHVLCKVGKNIIFQNKTLLVMFYRHFGTNFVILNIFWKQQIVKTVWPVRVQSSLLVCHHTVPVWDWVTVGTSLCCNPGGGGYLL